MAGGRRASFDTRAARSGFRLTAAQRTQQQPEVEDHTGPTGGHLHPEGRPAAVGEGGLQHCRLVAGGQNSLTVSYSRREKSQEVNSRAACCRPT